MISYPQIWIHALFCPLKDITTAYCSPEKFLQILRVYSSFVWQSLPGLMPCAHFLNLIKMKLNLYGKCHFSLLLDLDKKVFGGITTKEIIGAAPPAFPDTKKNLEDELGILIAELETLSDESLKDLLQEQKIAQEHINSRPGAMALAQNKIQLFNEYSKKYLQAIQQRLQS